MEIGPIKSDADHAAALREVEALWGAATGSAEGDRLDVLATLIDAYERTRWPVDDLDPVAAIEAEMAMNGRTRADLARLIGQSRATEVLARRRALTLPMIRAISREWRIPERLLVRSYTVSGRTATPRSHTASTGRTASAG
ncbi:MAG: transcriptional regulator [Sphingomonadaceae bacterium]|nr:transcriptional regulator [Sphingomonadaceae bacterium]